MLCHCSFTRITLPGSFYTDHFTLIIYRNPFTPIILPWPIYPDPFIPIPLLWSFYCDPFTLTILSWLFNHDPFPMITNLRNLVFCLQCLALLIEANDGSRSIKPQHIHAKKKRKNPTEAGKYCLAWKCMYVAIPPSLASLSIQLHRIVEGPLGGYVVFAHHGSYC